jgi:hypothetical protein
MARKRKPASGNKAQPVVDIPAARHGDAAELEMQQAAAPMQGPSPEVPTQQPAPVQGNPGPVFGPSAFRPTERPGEPITSGIPMGPGHSGQNLVIPTDTVDDFLRAMYAKFPSNAILRLLKE